MSLYLAVCIPIESLPVSCASLSLCQVVNATFLLFTCTDVKQNFYDLKTNLSVMRFDLSATCSSFVTSYTVALKTGISGIPW